MRRGKAARRPAIRVRTEPEQRRVDDGIVDLFLEAVVVRVRLDLVVWTNSSSVCPRNVMSDFGGEVMAEVLAERALVRPQIIPLVPLTNQYRHQDHMDLKDYKSKVRPLLL